LKSAILLLGFNRTDYFQQVLSSLENNADAFNHDLHVYLDGGPKSKQEEIVELVKSSKFENVTYVMRDSNWGIGRHLIDARRTLFDELGYDRILLLEDDMVLAPTYVETVFAISDWSSKYDDIGTVMAYNINHDSEDLQIQQMNQLIATNRHFWGYVITKKVWDEIKHIIYEFEQNYLLKYTYTNRPHRRIRWFFMRKWLSKGRAKKQNCLVSSDLVVAPFPKLPFRVATSQDAITALALWHHGYSRITTRVSRAEYVGIEGYSFSPEVYESQGFNNQNLLDFSSFDSTEDFKFISKDENGESLMPRRYE
tara:strand:- start:35 stop:964 length:930 start_codon:yes stop_codon:yes gene_type:complete